MPQCIDPDRLGRMRAAIDETFTLTKDNTRFSTYSARSGFSWPAGLRRNCVQFWPLLKIFPLSGAGFLQLGPDFVGLIDHPKILPLLQEFIGPKLRLDHTYGMAMAADGRGEGEGLHHEGNGGSHGIGHGSYYHTHGQRMHSGLLVVAFSLTDNPAGMGFSVVPGSHKALFPTPRGLGGMDAANSYSNGIVVQPELKAGDALLFTEACRHGTMPWTEPRWERRALLMKFCPHYMAFSDTPMSLRGIGGENGEQLTVRQKMIMSKAGVSLGPQDWEGADARGQWRPHLDGVRRPNSRDTTNRIDMSKL